MKHFEEKIPISPMTNVNHDFEHDCLIWLDASAHTSSENLATQNEFRSIIHHFKTFVKVSDCEEFIRSKSNTDRIYLISSGIFGQQLIPRIASLRQFIFGYVYCRDKRKNELWSKNIPKISGVFVELESLIKQIELDHLKRRQSKIDEPFPLHIGKSDRNFIYCQILFDCLVHMKSLSVDQPALIEFCEKVYEDDLHELDVIKTFQENYSSEKSIWWYTRDCSISRILTKTLCDENLDLLFQFGFIIRDIYDTLQKNRCQTSLHLFYGQIMSMNEFDQLKNSTGEYFLLKRFLSANLHRHKVIDALRGYSTHNDLIRVLFEIEADPRENPSKPFANITSLSYTKNETLVMFMVGSIFRFVSIQLEKKTQIWIVKIVFSNLGKSYNASNLISCGQILFEQLNASDQAEKYFLRLVKETPSTHLDIYFISLALAQIAFTQCHYALSLNWYQEAMKVAKIHQIHLGRTLFYLGCTYQKIGDHQEALECYDSALKYWDEQNRPDESMIISDCWNNMGCICESEEYYSKALECHRHARTIREELNLNLGSTFNNIGNVYLAIGEYKLALEHYQFALEAKKKIFSARHETIAMTLANIALVYEFDQNWKKASHYYTSASSIFSDLYPPVHMYNIQMKENLQRVNSSMVHFQSADLSSETVV